MRNEHPFEIIGLIGLLIFGGLFFVWIITLSGTIPEGSREASPGFGWSWDFDYESAIREAGRPGAQPWPRPATAEGNRLLLPLDQPLHFKGLKLTYRGMSQGDSFRIDVVVLDLDRQFTYRHTVGLEEAEQGFTLGERHFILEKITSRDLLLNLAPRG